MEPVDTQKGLPPAQSPSPAERRLSFAIVGVLVLTAVVILMMQSRYDPAAWQLRAKDQGAVSTSSRQESPEEKAVDEIAGLSPMSAAEIYNADTLSDKINGKAELYLGAGFQKLETRRFAMDANAGAWMERYVYDMGAKRNAFAVFSSQRRQGATAFEMAEHGFLSSNGLFFVHGPYYVEIIAAETSASVQAKIKEMAARFIRTHGDAGPDIPELNLLPSAFQVPDSVVLIADSAFGISGMDWVFTAAYQKEAAQATVFVTRRDSHEKANALAEAFMAFWIEYGGETVPAQAALTDGRIVTILDSYEIVMVQGPYVLGVHEATHIAFGVEVAAALLQSVKEKMP